MSTGLIIFLVLVGVSLLGIILMLFPSIRENVEDNNSKGFNLGFFAFLSIMLFIYAALAETINVRNWCIGIGAFFALFSVLFFIRLAEEFALFRPWMSHYEKRALRAVKRIKSQKNLLVLQKRHRIGKHAKQQLKD